MYLKRSCKKLTSSMKTGKNDQRRHRVEVQRTARGIVALWAEGGHVTVAPQEFSGHDRESRSGQSLLSLF